MKIREAAGEGEDNRPAAPGMAGRNAGGPARGAASGASGGNRYTGQEQKLIEQLIERSNLNAAWKRTRRNKGAAGTDGLDIEGTASLIRREWEGIKTQLLAGEYRPRPVRRVEIPKPGGGTRKLGVPTVLDRFIQQAALQVLAPLFEPGFSEHSYGFRPGRSAHQAVRAARQYQRDGKRWVVDLDLKSFFDLVNHDLLMSRVRRKVKDVRMLRLIRAYLTSGVMVSGRHEESAEGTPQGGPLSPLLSNILLDDLDKELEKRGHSFCRYADDCNIYVASKASGQRVMASLTSYLEKVLKLTVNREKSAVARPVNRSFLGFSFTAHRDPKIRVPESTARKLRTKLKDHLNIGRGQSIEALIQETLNPLLRGWMAYFRLSETERFARELDGWLRRHLRRVSWLQWKTATTRYRRLVALGLSQDHARRSAGNGRGAWYNSNASHLKLALPDGYFDAMGLFRLLGLPDAHVTPTL